jgi:hypothetical protein
MYAVTSIPFVSRTRAIFRSAEFGFFGVIVRTCVQTPRFCGDPFPRMVRFFSELYVNRRAGALVFLVAFLRPFRTSWLIVGTRLYLRATLRDARASPTRYCRVPLPDADLPIRGAPGHTKGRQALLLSQSGVRCGGPVPAVVTLGSSDLYVIWRQTESARWRTQRRMLSTAVPYCQAGDLRQDSGINPRSGGEEGRVFSKVAVFLLSVAFLAQACGDEDRDDFVVAVTFRQPPAPNGLQEVAQALKSYGVAGSRVDVVTEVVRPPRITARLRADADLCATVQAEIGSRPDVAELQCGPAPDP